MNPYRIPAAPVFFSIIMFGIPGLNKQKKYCGLTIATQRDRPHRAFNISPASQGQSLMEG